MICHLRFFCGIGGSFSAGSSQLDMNMTGNEEIEQMHRFSFIAVTVDAWGKLYLFEIKETEPVPIIEWRVESDCHGSNWPGFRGENAAV
jgi:hypothetical protein